MKVVIDLDTRQLRRRDDGHYTSGAGKITCDHCVLRPTCPIEPLEACNQFLPAFPFTPADPLIVSRCNPVDTDTVAR